MEDLPAAEQAAVKCAAQKLTDAPGVHGVKLYPQRRTIIEYTFTGKNGNPVRSRIRIDGWNPPGQPVSYYYEIIDDQFMQGGNRTGDVRNLMSECGLGQTVVTD